MKWLIALSMALFFVGATKNLLRTLESDKVAQTNSLLQAYAETYKRHGIDPRFTLVVLAQDTWETNWGKSAICLTNHNRFGMRHNTRGYSLGPRSQHAYYERPSDSLRDYGLWQAKMLKARPDVQTEEDYLNMLDDYDVPWCPDCRYAEDTSYTRKIRIRMKEIKELDRI